MFKSTIIFPHNTSHHEYEQYFKDHRCHCMGAAANYQKDDIACCRVFFQNQKQQFTINFRLVLRLSSVLCVRKFLLMEGQRNSVSMEICPKDDEIYPKEPTKISIQRAVLYPEAHKLP
ncbi:hypothetical protein T02_3002 [Trichinella nativa]|uniref:Uncharacterized protein n=1 Tax=Trichinella nativa TaxID=6335 RepID=A0A0V1KLG9_9BILA|nr:hypothetical protein T02_3002 [Trichinella nativa]